MIFSIKRDIKTDIFRSFILHEQNFAHLFFPLSSFPHFFFFFWFLGPKKIIVMVLLKIDKWKSIIAFFLTEIEVAPPHKTFRGQIGDGWMHPALTVVYMMHIPGILSEAFLKSCLNPVLKKYCSSQPSMVHWLSSSIFPCLFGCLSRYGDTGPNLTSFCPRSPKPLHFWKLIIMAIQKWIGNTNTKTKTNTKTMTKTKTPRE